MNKIKRVSLFLVLIVLLTSLQGCSVPVNHYSQNYLHSGFCYYATVEYDTHVDYGEVISFNICTWIFFDQNNIKFIDSISCIGNAAIK